MLSRPCEQPRSNGAQRSHPRSKRRNPPDEKGNGNGNPATTSVTPGERRDDPRVTRRLPTATSPPPRTMQQLRCNTTTRRNTMMETRVARTGQARQRQ
ncbi:hypothetical protein K443DRAFT_308256 [Laccaria amethystina LaAM-08-1]|uniref:Uncharacterized protein n=1 Tax=Laccaria amethystina LaAM-08-1 TaxID=1095629 RepID=A0A0C9XWV0_9AGAR|nr:hypothetical protein K443DRAFT_308256 [Laccaria amethystina LaAM-08-1]